MEVEQATGQEAPVAAEVATQSAPTAPAESDAANVQAENAPPLNEQQRIDPLLQLTEPSNVANTSEITALAPGNTAAPSSADDNAAAAGLGVDDIFTALTVVRDADNAAAAAAEAASAQVILPPPADYDHRELHGVPLDPLFDFLSHLHDPFKLLRVHTILKACKTPKSYFRVDKRLNPDYKPEAEAAFAKQQSEETAKAVMQLAQRGRAPDGQQEAQGGDAAEGQPSGDEPAERPADAQAIAADGEVAAAEVPEAASVQAIATDGKVAAAQVPEAASGATESGTSVAAENTETNVAAKETAAEIGTSVAAGETAADVTTSGADSTAPNADQTASAAAADEPHEVPEEIQRVPILKELRIDIETLHPSALYRLEEYRRSELNLPPLEVTFVDYLARRSLKPKTPEPIDYAALEAEEKARETKRLKRKAKGFTAALYGKEDEIVIENGEVVRELPEDPELDAMEIDADNSEDDVYKAPPSVLYSKSPCKKRVEPRALNYTPPGEYTLEVLVPMPKWKPVKQAKAAKAKGTWRPGGPGKVPQWWKDQQAQQAKETPSSSSRATRARGNESEPRSTRARAASISTRATSQQLEASPRTTRSRAEQASPTKAKKDQVGATVTKRSTRATANVSPSPEQEPRAPQRPSRAGPVPAPQSGRRTRATAIASPSPEPEPRPTRRSTGAKSMPAPASEPSRRTRAAGNISPPTKPEPTPTRRSANAKSLPTPDSAPRTSRSGLQRPDPPSTRASGPAEAPKDAPARASRSKKAASPEQPRVAPARTARKRARKVTPVAREFDPGDYQEGELELELESEDGMISIDEGDEPTFKRPRATARRGRGGSAARPTRRHDEPSPQFDPGDVLPTNSESDDEYDLPKDFDRPSEVAIVEPFESLK